MRHVKIVFFKYGCEKSVRVCTHTSTSSNFNSRGFPKLKSRTDFDVFIAAFDMRFVFCRDFTGYSERSLPVFEAYISFRTSRAASSSPTSMRNLGDSGKKKSQSPRKMLDELRRNRHRMSYS